MEVVKLLGGCPYESIMTGFDHKIPENFPFQRPLQVAPQSLVDCDSPVICRTLQKRQCNVSVREVHLLLLCLYKQSCLKLPEAMQEVYLSQSPQI